MIVPYTQYKAFCKEWNTTDISKHLRFGQAFFNFAELHKMTSTVFLNKLYNANDVVAEKMLLDIVDYEN